MEAKEAPYTIQGLTEAVPKKKMKWITTEIRQKIRERRKTERTYKKKPSTENLLIYKRVKAETRRMMKKTRKEMWEEFVGTINEKTIRQVSGKRKTHQIRHDHK
jgi:hypothetical protein